MNPTEEVKDPIENQTEEVKQDDPVENQINSQTKT